MAHFLDYTGLQDLWTKIKQWISAHFVDKTGDTMTGDLRAPAYYVGDTINKTTSVTTDTDGTMFLESFIQGPRDDTTYGSKLKLAAADNNPYFQHYMNGQWGPWRKVMLEDTCPFPVGGIYISVDSANPSTIWWGTTWEAVATGRFLVGANSTYGAGSTGDPTHTHTTGNHTLTAAESGVPAHSHGNTIKATTPKFTHTITQPAFKLPNHHHYTSSGYAEKAGTDRLAYTALDGVTNRQYGLGAVDFIQNPTTLPACTRTTNVAVGDHAATACTMSGSVSNNTAANATAAHNHGDTGAATAIPPWFGAYMWKRTA